MSAPRKGKDGWRDGKGQIGIDGNKDAGFGRGRNTSWDSSPQGNRVTGAERAAYTNNESGLRNKMPDDAVNSSHDIFDNVEKNSGNGAPGPVKYGVD